MSLTTIFTRPSFDYRVPRQCYSVCDLFLNVLEFGCARMLSQYFCMAFGPEVANVYTCHMHLFKRVYSESPASMRGLHVFFSICGGVFVSLEHSHFTSPHRASRRFLFVLRPCELLLISHLPNHTCIIALLLLLKKH